MPTLIDKYDSTSRTYTSYKLYSKEEIKREWNLFKTTHLEGMSTDTPYVTCNIDSEEKVLVLIALLIRRTNTDPSCFYYDSERKKLLANCNYAQAKSEDLKETYIAVIDMFAYNPNLANMKKDPVGQDLFDEKMPIIGALDANAAHTFGNFNTHFQLPYESMEEF